MLAVSLSMPHIRINSCLKTDLGIRTPWSKFGNRDEFGGYLQTVVLWKKLKGFEKSKFKVLDFVFNSPVLFLLYVAWVIEWVMMSSILNFCVSKWFTQLCLNKIIVSIKKKIMSSNLILCVSKWFTKLCLNKLIVSTQ